jgi:TetR/AcrR family transcriptional repressor of nem operon
MTGHIEFMARASFRDDILSAGLAALHARGFNGTSVQDITDAAGVPKGSFYNHFASKEDLGTAAVDKYVAVLSVRLAVLADADLPPLTRLRRYFEGLIDLAGNPGTTGCLLGNFGAELSNQSPIIRERVRGAFDDWTGALAVIIDEAKNRGDLPSSTDPAAVASFLIDAWEGAVLRAKVKQDCAPLRLFLEMAFSKILV